MKITLFDSLIGSGGAERVLTTIANELVNTCSVSIVTFQSTPDEIFYDIDKHIEVRCLDLLKKSKGLLDALGSNIYRIKSLREEIKTLAPDVIVSFLPENNVLTILSCVGLNIPVIVTEHTDPYGTALGKKWDNLRKLLYKRADVLVVLNLHAKQYFEMKFNLPVVVIPNPISTPFEEESEIELKISSPYIITIGRQVKNKRIEDVISAFSKLKNEFKEWELVVVGDGPLNKDLKEFTSIINAGDAVVFTGLVPSPGHLLKNAEMFVSASITEVFPMAICEAMACGLPVIAREYNKSIKDIITDGRSGILVNKDSQKDLVSAMRDMMTDKEQREKLGEEARYSMQRFSPDKVMSKWLDLFNKLTEGETPDFEYENKN